MKAWTGWKLLLAVALVCGLATGLLNVRTQHLWPGTENWEHPADHHKYVHMTQVPVGSFHIQPPCWRIAVPWVAGHLPGDPIANFLRITIVSLWLTGVLLFYWLGDKGFSWWARWAGVGLYYSYGAVTKLLLAGTVALDPVAFLLLLVGLWLIERREGWGRDIAFALVLAVGATVKETALLAGPLYYSMQARRWIDFRLGFRTAALMIPAILVTLVLRSQIPGWNDNDTYTAALGPKLSWVHEGSARYDTATAFRTTMARYRQETPIGLLRLFTYNSLGLLLFLPLFAVRRNALWVLRWAPYWLPLGWSLLIALNADRRLGALLFLLIPAALEGTGELGRKLGIPASWWVGIFGFQWALNLLQPVTAIVPFDLAAAGFLLSLAVAWNLRPAGETVASYAEWSRLGIGTGALSDR